MFAYIGRYLVEEPYFGQHTRPKNCEKTKNQRLFHQLKNKVDFFPCGLTRVNSSVSNRIFSRKKRNEILISFTLVNCNLLKLNLLFL